MSDPRTTAANDRVVARWLAADFPSLTPVDPEPPAYVNRSVADLSSRPGGPRDRQLRYGELFEVLERRGDHAFGIAMAAEYVGWLRQDGIGAETDRGEALHWVGARQTRAYEAPDFKSAETAALAHMSLVSAGEVQGRFTRTELGWVPTAHLTDTPTDDFVSAAELYLGADYLWGGNSVFGIDCSGLVQAACHAAGLPCPGDSDQQEEALGHPVPQDAPVERGDLFFWKGHVALAVNARTLIHANAYHMAVTYEPLDKAIARIQAQGDGPVTSRRRL